MFTGIVRELGSVVGADGDEKGVALRIDAPITADGLRAKEFDPQGRLAQSIAFLSPPGVERVY